MEKDKKLEKIAGKHYIVIVNKDGIIKEYGGLEKHHDRVEEVCRQSAIDMHNKYGGKIRMEFSYK